MKRSCSFCREPGGTDSMYPVYGMRPHTHGIVAIGGIKIMLLCDLPFFQKGFVPDDPSGYNSPGQMGIHYCKRCGAGRPNGHLRHHQLNRARLSMKRYRRRKARAAARDHARFKYTPISNVRLHLVMDGGSVLIGTADKGYIKSRRKL